MTHFAKNNGCSSCGDKKADCHASPAVLQINNPSECVIFHKTTIPASMGDETTIPPVNGAYKNMLVYYEGSGAVYLYSSDGIPTLINYTDYVRLTSKPSINGVVLIGNKTLADLGIPVRDIYEIETNDNYFTYRVYKNGELLDIDVGFQALSQDAATQDLRWVNNPSAVFYNKCVGAMDNIIYNCVGGNELPEECGQEAGVTTLVVNADGTYSSSYGNIAFKTRLELVSGLYSGDTFIDHGVYHVSSNNPIVTDGGSDYQSLVRFFRYEGGDQGVVLTVTYGQSGQTLVLGDTDFDTENGQTVIRMELMSVSHQEIYSIIFRSDSTYTVTNRYKITTTDLIGT